MIPITDKHIQEYQEITLAVHGEEISNELAQAELTNLLCFMDTVMRYARKENSNPTNNP